jgi:arsenical pump membrane protein
MAFLGIPLWPVAAAGGIACVLASARAGHSVATLARGVAWPVFPFLTGVFVVAVALERIGVVAWLHQLYAASAHRLATIGVVSALGSAVLNNHPMSVLNVFALDGLEGGDTNAFAALVGGDLGPRLLPVGSLASLLWFDVLKKHEVTMSVKEFVRLGVLVTIPTLAVSLAVLGLVQMLGL